MNSMSLELLRPLFRIIFFLFKYQVPHGPAARSLYIYFPPPPVCALSPSRPCFFVRSFAASDGKFFFRRSCCVHRIPTGYTAPARVCSRLPWLGFFFFDEEEFSGAGDSSAPPMWPFLRTFYYTLALSYLSSFFLARCAASSP